MPEILAIDDNQDNLTAISALLKKHIPGCTVFTQLYGEEGINDALEKKPDIILLDIRMPIMDGFEVCRQLKANPLTKYIPIIMLTAMRRESGSLVKALEMGADAFLSKPIDEPELVAQVNAMLRIKWAEDHLRREKGELVRIVDVCAGEIQEGQEKYSSVLETTSEGFWLVDEKNKLLEVNPAYCRMSGYTKGELSGRDVTELEDGEAWAKAASRMLTEKKKKSLRFESVHRHRDGYTFITEVSVTYCNLYSGSFIVFIRDITERKKTERQLRESERRMKITLEETDQGLWEWDYKSGDIVFDKNWQVIIGYTPGEIHFDFAWWIRSIHPLSVPVFEKALKDYLEGREKFYELEYRMKSKSGEWMWIRSRGLCVEYDEKGKPLKFIGTHRDITERKQNEVDQNRLQRNLESLWNISSKSNASLQEISTDVLAEIIRLTDSLYGFYGFLNKDETKYSIYSWSNETMSDCETHEKPIFYHVNQGGLWGAALRTKKPLTVNNYTMTPGRQGTPAGHIKITRFIAVPVIRDGKIAALGAVANKENDYTEDDINQIRSYMENAQTIADRIQAEEEKKRLEKELLHSQKLEAIGQLAGGIAHDFNNMLGIILGYAELSLDDVPEGSELENNLRQIMKAVSHSRDLVWQILTFSQQNVEEMKPLMLRPLVKEVLKLLKVSLPSSIVIKENIGKDTKPVLANAVKIHEVVMNLCINAAHAMKEEGVLEVALSEVTISAKKQGRFSRLEPGAYGLLVVKDSGHGIDETIMERIFEPFFTTKATGEGSGMGLAVVYGIVNECGGSIFVDSRPGDGTEFRLFFPKVERSVPEKSGKSVGNIRGEEKILLVDDEEMMRVAIKAMLESLGYRVTLASDGLMALDIFKADPGHIDVVVTDQTMPRMTGINLAGELMALRKDIPVILCTGFSNKAGKEETEAVGIKKTLMKPITRDILGSAIRDVLL